MLKRNTHLHVTSVGKIQRYDVMCWMDKVETIAN